MAITKLPRSGIADNSINASKIEDGTIAIAEVSGTISNAKLKDGEIANAKLSNSTITIRGTSRALGTSVTVGVDVDWQSVITSNTTMVVNKGYFVNTTSGAISMTLPASAVIGDTIAIKDYAGTFASNNLTILRNGHNIQGVANESIISTARASIVLVYVDSTKGWLYTDEHNVADLQAATFITATGGTILTVGDYKTHVFTGDGNFVVSAVGNPEGGPSVADYFVVAGGAANGAGGFRVSNSAPRSGIPAPTMSPLVAAPGITLSVQTYPISVGAGGASIPAGGSKGSNSVFSTITSAGGGLWVNSNYPGNQNGGSGGGGGAYTSWSPQIRAAGSGNTPPVSPSQGNPGAAVSGLAAPGGASIVAGGGGGAGAAASGPITVSNGPGALSPNADGGIGSFISDNLLGPTAPSYGTPGPTSSTRYFAGGGAGFSQVGAGFVEGGTGGSGGGGQTATGSDTAGGANTGGGGGVGYNTNGAAGGKGIVIIRYKFQ